MRAVPSRDRQPAGWPAAADWAQIEAAASRVAGAMRRYLRQLGTFLAPRSVDAAENALRQLSRWMITDAGLAATPATGSWWNCWPGPGCGPARGARRSPLLARGPESGLRWLGPEEHRSPGPNRRRCPAANTASNAVSDGDAPRLQAVLRPVPGPQRARGHGLAGQTAGSPPPSETVSRFCSGPFGVSTPFRGCFRYARRFGGQDSVARCGLMEQPTGRTVSE